MDLRRAPRPKPLPTHGVRAWESHHDRDFRMDPEAHPFVELFYVLAGAGWVELDSVRHPCQAGDVAVAAPGVAHRFIDREPLTLYGLEVAAVLLPADPAAAARLSNGRPVGDPHLAKQMRTGLRRLLHEQARERPGGAALAVGLALQLVAAVVRAARPAPTDDPEAAVAGYVCGMAERFFEPLTIDAAVDELGVSRRHFTRLFRKVTGVSFAEHLERLRVEHAARALRASDRGVTLVAFESGYEDLSGFYRAFRRHFGKAPQQWRAGGGGPG